MPASCYESRQHLGRESMHILHFRLQAFLIFSFFPPQCCELFCFIKNSPFQGLREKSEFQLPAHFFDFWFIYLFPPIMNVEAKCMKIPDLVKLIWQVYFKWKFCQNIFWNVHEVFIMAARRDQWLRVLLLEWVCGRYLTNVHWRIIVKNIILIIII